MSPSQAERGAALRDLHAGEPFVIPNPWDAKSARMLEGLGFKALTSTSGGFAETIGKTDGQITLDECAGHARALSDAVSIPVAMDLENAYGPAPADAARAIERVAAAGAVGGSIEDWDPGERVIYCLEHAVARIAAAVDAARSLPFPFTVVARAENHFRGVGDLGDTIERLRAFAGAGADCLYAPGLRDIDDVRTVCAAIDRPFNALAYPGMSLAALAGAGAQRVSVGSFLHGFGADEAPAVARRIAESGEFY